MTGPGPAVFWAAYVPSADAENAAVPVVYGLTAEGEAEAPVSFSLTARAEAALDTEVEAGP